MTDLPTDVLLGIAACAFAVVLALVALFEPGRLRLALTRRRPGASGAGVFTRGTSTLTARLETAMSRRDLGTHTAVLERAGVHSSLARVTLLIAGGAIVCGLVGLLLAGPVLGLVLAVAVPVVVRIVLGLRAGRRRNAFANQLEDSLQLMASSLRAGHSLPQALATVAQDAEEPTREEFTRILNETRVGRDVSLALDETAVRMVSRDFAWVSEAIAINREIGGNLAEVLDRVTTTIRDRTQLRRQVATLSAEGKLSAYILLALPFAIAGFLSVANPSYLGRFTESAAGYGLLALGAVLLVIGSVLLRKIVSFNY